MSRTDGELHKTCLVAEWNRIRPSSESVDLVKSHEIPMLYCVANQPTSVLVVERRVVVESVVVVAPGQVRAVDYSEVQFHF